MTSRIAVISIDALNPQRVADFWAAALSWVAVVDPSGGFSLTPPGIGTGGPVIDVLPVPESKTIKNRLHLDLRADGTTQAEEVERLLRLGAVRADVGQGGDVSWVVLADPEGNEFCVLQRSVQEAVASESTETPDSTATAESA